MPRLIFKCPYIKPGGSGGGNFVRYIATRDGVQCIQSEHGGRPATERQQALIQTILTDMPDTKTLHEYADYEQTPTIANASDFITQALEQHLQESGNRDAYVKYIAERPRVEKQGAHGLFGPADAPIVLSQVQAEVAAHTGNVWTPIISLRREDASRLGYDNTAAWQKLLQLHAVELAKQMKIQPRNFRWYAAFHNESHHPHCHMVCWSANPKEGFLTEPGIERVKSVLARDIFEQDLISIYQEQTVRRDTLRQESMSALRDLSRSIQSGTCNSPVLERLLREISITLPSRGKMVYGYMPLKVKNLIDAAVDELEKNPQVTACYDAWYESRNAVYHTYTDHPPSKLPLSQQQEFKSIKNMVLRQALSLCGAIPDAPAEDILPAEPAPDVSGDDAVSSPELEPQPDDTEPHASWSSEYKQARTYLFGTKEVEPDFEKAHALFLREAESGNAFAMHDLGRMYADGLGVDADSSVSHQWYAKALVAFHAIESGKNDEDRGVTYLRYRIGKMYMTGLGMEQDYTEAAAWLAQAAADNHKYAQYSLASLYYRGQGVAQDYETAFALYSKSAVQHNAYASYELGKMCRDGIGTAVNAVAAQSHFQTAFTGFVEMELEGSDDRLQYRIGQMLRDGVGVEPDQEQAAWYFERSAELGNPHAQYALAKHYLSSGEPEKIIVAVALLQESADADNPTAQYALGKLYCDGVAGAVEADISKAIDYFTKSAEQENEFAAYALGKLFLEGDAVPQDVPTALRWLGESAVHGNQFAQYTLGKLYRDGLEGRLERNISKAVDFLTKSAKQKNELAAYALGKLYLNGEHISQDISAAVRWLGESAEHGNQFAQYTLGKLYLNGEHVQKDVDTAIRWLTVSAEQDNQFAQYQLGRLYAMGKDIPRDREKALYWLEKSAAQGNAYAQFFIDHIDEIGVGREPDLFMASTNLLRQLGKIFEQEHQRMALSPVIQIDRKRRRELQQKKLAQGHAWDDREVRYSE